MNEESQLDDGPQEEEATRKLVTVSGDFNLGKLFDELATLPELNHVSGPLGPKAVFGISGDPNDPAAIQIDLPIDFDEEKIAGVLEKHDPTPAAAAPTRKQLRDAALDAIDETQPAAALKAIKALLRDLD